jgi:serine/threonine-protein phosphatase 2A regulatory subunit B'
MDFVIAFSTNLTSDRCVSKFLYQDLPNLSDVPAQDKDQLFVRKLRLCSYIFEFEPEPKPDAAGNIPPPNPDPWAAEKEIKRQALLELVDHLNKSKPVLSEPILHELIEMVSVNLFRPLPPASAEIGIYDPDEDDPVRFPHPHPPTDTVPSFYHINTTHPSSVSHHLPLWSIVVKFH